jgi:hypothetical protein
VRRTTLFVLIGALTSLIPAYAHHSFARDYFEDQSVTYEGNVSQFQYRNPHALLMFDVRGDRGQMQTYAAEWRGTNRLAAAGITASTLKPGDRVVVTGSPGRKASDRRLHLKGIHRPSDGWRWPSEGSQ